MKFRTGFFISFAIHIAVIGSVAILLSHNNNENPDSNYIEIKTVVSMVRTSKLNLNDNNPKNTNRLKNNGDDNERKNNDANIHSFVKNRLNYLAQNEPPDYPEFCRRNNLEGEVVLEIEILTNGQTGKIRVIKTNGHRYFKEAAVEAAKNWNIITDPEFLPSSNIVITQKIYFRIQS